MSYNITPESASVDYLRPKMSEMIERVAEAIKAVETTRYITREDAEAFARAAIAAMREPTERMVEVGGWRYPGPSSLYTAMIDAALSERPEMKSPSQNPTHIQKGNEQNQDNDNLDHSG